MTKSQHGNKCEFCYHRWVGEGHCYMFKEEPPHLCAQFKLDNNAVMQSMRPPIETQEVPRE